GHGLRARPDRGHFWPRHRNRRPRQGQLVFHLVHRRHDPAAHRPGRGSALPLREGRARAPLSPVRQGREALRPGLPALRRGPLPPRSLGGAPAAALMATYVLIHGGGDSAFYWHLLEPEIDGWHCPALSRPRELADRLEAY